MCEALHGKDTCQVSEDVAAGIVMAIPDFPYSRLAKKEVSGYPVYGWDKIRSRNFHPAEMKAGLVWEQEGENLKQVEGMVTAGDYVCVVSGNGGTVLEAQEAAYRNLKKIELPNSPMYRTDIGDRLKENLPVLQSHGFCIDWRF
jgi:phosphoribosylamine--glycine ligase